jgi:hypothetical protein
MKGLDHAPYLQLYIIANVLAVLLIVAAWKRPSWARWGLILLFGWASYTNAITSYRDPRVYLEDADLTFFPVYRTIILGVFSEHIALYVGLVALSQALIPLGLLLGGMIARIAGWGAIAFLLAIAPFGVGSGFPSTVLYAMAIFLLLRTGLAQRAWQGMPLKTDEGQFSR